jgi:hypothetical protein
MITITNKEFNNKVDLMLEQYEISKGEPLGRQAKATKRGTLLEDVAELASMIKDQSRFPTLQC